MDSIWFRSPPPGYDANGDEIIYTSEVYNLPDHTEYRVTKDTYDYDYYAQRTFDFTMIWKEGDEDRHYYQLCDNDLTLVAKVKDYFTNPNSTVTLDEIQVYVDNVVKIIDDNFVLERENGDSDILIDLSEENHDHTKRHNISFDPKTKHVTINCLDDISRTGEAIVYYLQQKNDDKLSAAGTDPIDTNDYWNIRMENTGVNSANTTQLFHDAVIDLLLSGKDDFNGHIHWDDEDRADVRAADANRGSLYLWRYTTNIDYSAQADSQPLATKDDQGNVVPAGDSPFCFSDCDKYDIDGYRYTYYVKESLRSPDYRFTHTTERNNYILLKTFMRSVLLILLKHVKSGRTTASLNTENLLTLLHRKMFIHLTILRQDKRFK